MNALDPEFQAFQLVRRMRTVVPMVSACPESGFIGAFRDAAAAAFVINNRPRRLAGDDRSRPAEPAPG
ncbi:MAG TPA: hypothetical protein VE888_13145, partial [Streptosporangiaceae bacterium]|nr:hypothetical protein [Streptosporangiaceae bacterium]